MQTKQIVVEVPENMMAFFEELMDKLSIPMVDKLSLDEPISSGLSEEDLDELQRRESEYLKQPEKNRSWEEMENELRQKHGK